MRRIKIVSLINDKGSISVEELSVIFNVSLETIRRDLRRLDAEGLIKRVHGGANSKKVNDIGRSFSERLKDKISIKESLVKQALKYIKEDMVIGLDASSSSWCLANKIPNIPCTIVTNSIKNVIALEDKENIKIICTGGTYSPKYGGFHGAFAINTLSNLSIDMSFISCVGFDNETGVWDSNEYNYQIKQTFIDISDKVILLADSSKYGKKSLLRVCDISTISEIITEKL
ncbi:DeoR/GlpR family DNA-binding transcription regulator [Photobacterium damselae]|uniref:DeoR/GlpR family DNA-binding transcription regulator n=1 Tax=Photobacterium damselae TaxID=38293 RepID=UPI003D7E1281